MIDILGMQKSHTADYSIGAEEFVATLTGCGTISSSAMNNCRMKITRKSMGKVLFYGMMLLEFCISPRLFASGEPNLQLVSLKVNGDLYQNKQGSFTVTLKNNGMATYNSRLWVYLEKTYTYSPNQTIGGDVYSIVAGETKTITITGTITLPPDTYDCNMVYDAKNNPSKMSTYQFHNVLRVQAIVKTSNNSNYQLSGSTSGNNIIDNQSSEKKADVGTSVITPQTRFTNTLVCPAYGERYHISYKDGNLYDGKKQLVLTAVKDVLLGVKTYYALRNDGTLWAWGKNDAGQVGDNTGIDKDKPIKILDNVKDVTVDGFSVWAVKNDGTVYAWGGNSNARLGFGDSEDRYTPEKLPIENVKYITMSYEESSVRSPVPIPMPPIRNIIAVTWSGAEYQWCGNNIKGEDLKRFNISPKLMTVKNNIIYSCNSNTYDYSGRVTSTVHYKLMSNGEFYKDNELLASNVGSADCDNRGSSHGYGSYLTKNGDLYAWGQAIGDGSNVPRKNPVLVFQNVIKANNFQSVIPANRDRWLLTINGKLYRIDRQNSFKYELEASNVYMYFFEQEKNHTTRHIGIIYFTNNGSIYDDNGKLILEDVALPQIKQ